VSPWRTRQVDPYNSQSLLGFQRSKGGELCSQPPEDPHYASRRFCQGGDRFIEPHSHRASAQREGTIWTRTCPVKQKKFAADLFLSPALHQ
jgi:hypothetical protein